MLMKKSIILFVILSLVVFVLIVVSCVERSPIYNTYEKSNIRELKVRGNDLLKSGRTDSALVYYTLAAGKLTENMPDSLKIQCAGAYNNIGYTYFFFKNNYVSAYEALLKALDIAETTNDSTIYPAIYLNLGNIFGVYGDYGLLTDNYRKSIHYAVAVEDSAMAIAAFTELMYEALARNEIAPISQDLSLFDSLGFSEENHDYTEAVYLRRALRKINDNDIDSAVYYLDKARTNINIDYTTDRAEWVCDNIKARLLLRSGRNRMALAMLDSLFKSDDIPMDMQAIIAKDLSVTYEKNSQPDSALKYSRLSQMMIDSVYSSQQYSMIKDVATTRAIHKLDSEIMLMNLKHRTARILLWCAVGAAILFLLLGIVIFIQYRKMRLRNRELYRKNIELMEMERKHDESLKKTTERKYKNSNLDDDTRFLLTKKITEVMKDEATITSSEFTLDYLSVIVDSNTSYVSQVINESFGKNFNTLLGEARVKIACQRLRSHSAYGNFTVEGIAIGLGFKSRSNFVNVFKKVTGLTPSEFRKLGKEEYDESVPNDK